MSDCNNYIKIQSRRDFLTKSAMGFGALGLSSLLSASGHEASSSLTVYRLP